MVAINYKDPTLQAVKAALRKEVNQQERRTYLGMSGIGHLCLRKHWYDFRWASNRDFSESAVLKIQDGYVGEDVMAERLRKLSGVKLKTEEQNGKQIACSDFGGHFKGHLDGIISGLYQAPKTEHVWEHKQVAESKFNTLCKLAASNQKEALKEWDLTYYSQAMMYCHYTKKKRHYLTCASPGGRDFIGVRTDASPTFAKVLRERAGTAINSIIPLQRISENKTWYECKWCDHHPVCHGNKLPNVNCRTCSHATPDTETGEWLCSIKGDDEPLTFDEQKGGCQYHLFIPPLVPNATPVDSGATWVKYAIKDTVDVIINGPDNTTSYEMVKT